MKKSVLLIAGALLLIVFYLIISKSYPVLVVNSDTASFKLFNRELNAAINYYQKLSEKSDNADIFKELSKAKKEIERALLDKLIEDSLIYKELKIRLKNEDLKNIVNKKIKEAIDKSDIQKGVEILYGLSVDDFKETVLRPQAEKEILESRFFLENKNFDEWLKNEKARAKIMIFLPGFSWNGEKIIINE